MMSSSQISSKPSNGRIAVGFLQNGQKAMTVFLGTYTVMFIGCGSLFMEDRGEITLVGVALAWSSAVVANIYTCGHISGAHINPSVTFALALAGKFPWKQVPSYVMAELLGSTFANLTLMWLFDGQNKDIMLTRPVGPNPASDLKVVALEAILTFMYALASIGSRADPRAAKEFGGVAVASTVFFAAIVAGKVTGASLNPARSLGPAVITGNFHKIWIYIVAPTIGSIAASTLYFFYLMPEKNADQSQKKTESTPADEETVAGSSNHPAFSQDFKNVSFNSIHPQGDSTEMA